MKHTMNTEILKHQCDNLRELLMQFDLILTEGCKDSGCYYVKPTGQVTNGGCRCKRNIECVVEDIAEEALRIHTVVINETKGSHR